MKSLRTQLLMSHLTLVALMVILMTGSAVSFRRLGRSIDRILHDNYASVVAAQSMREELEKQGSAAALFLSGQRGRARSEYGASRARFEDAFAREANNITEPGERAIVDEIRRRYAAYRSAIESWLSSDDAPKSADLTTFYEKQLEPALGKLKSLSKNVLELNQGAIFRADERARAEADRASWMGVGLATGAFFVALLFTVRMIRSALSPLKRLAHQAEEIGAGHLDQEIQVDRTDEIGVLSHAFNEMARRLREAWRAEEERLHRAERMSDAALESLYDPVIVTDAAGRVAHLNRAAEGLFGPENQATGLPVEQVVEDRRIAEAVERAIRHEHVSAPEDEAGLVPIQVESAQRTYRLRVTPMHDEHVVLGAAVVLEDVTHQRELDRLKTEFIGVASHELRTPVTSLLLSAQLLQEGAAGPLTPAQEEIVRAQREDLERLERLMRDLLDLTRLEAGVTPPRLEIVSPARLVASALESVAAQAESKGVSLSPELPDRIPTVRADRSLTLRALVNLLNNAIRHTPIGGRVVLRASMEDGTLAFSVIDSGSGIPAEYLPLIFERFVQVPGATRDGAGLGLCIARTIAMAHGGAIRAESEVGKGSTFTMTLPAAGSDPPDEEHADAGVSATGQEGR
jgi:PAS domain S-box-containing protein